MESFSAVLSTLDTKQLPVLGNTILRRIRQLQPQLQHIATNTTPSVGEPIYGSFHVLFPLTFDDGLRWIAKIPINGTADKWDELSASALVSEASTMRLLKRDTTIPLPDVLDFSSTTENSLRCPYIIMSFITGISLYDVWFGHRLYGVNPDTVYTRRTRALQDIASAMIQLDKFSFQSNGRPLFGNDGHLSSVGPMRQLDHKAMLDRWLIHQDPNEDPIYVEFPAFTDPKTYYTFMLDRYPEQKPFPKGIVTLLCQLINWIPEPNGVNPFVLTHQDFDIQNFIVSEDGELRGIIDWDGVAAVPRTLGNERYPEWLTRDWDPGMYGYVESMEDGVEPEGVWEDSPDCLATCRNIYDTIMARYCRDRALGSEANLCRMSLITENLAIAADNPRCRNDIVRKIVHEIWAVAGRNMKDLDFMSLVELFAEGNVENAVMDILREGLDTLLSREGL